MLRDTIIVEPLGHVVLRFEATNPGVWLFHCHVDWHLEQGLAAVFIEAPSILQQRETLNENLIQNCKSGSIPVSGNAAGNSKDWFDLEGLPRQPQPLPEGFTLKGYAAFALTTLVGLWGLYTIAQYGLGEVIQDDQEMAARLKQILESNQSS